MKARRIYLEYRPASGRARFYAAHVRRAAGYPPKVGGGADRSAPLPVEGHWLVVRHWGFVGCPGWHLSRLYASEAEAARALARLAARRARDGYRPRGERPAGGRAALPEEQLAMPLDGD